MRILVIRLSALGDIVMASGLIPALRARWPEAHIAWLAEPAGAALLEANPRLDEVIRLPRPDWRALRQGHHYGRLAGALHRFATDLRRRQFDLVVDTQGLLKSGIWAWASRAPRRVGLGSREGSARLMTEVLNVPMDHPRMASEYRQVAAHFGLPADPFPLDLALTEADRAAARSALQEAGVTGPYAVFCPFTTRPQKHWFDERWRKLARELPRRLDLAPVVLGGPGDRAAASSLLGADSPAVSLAGRLDLRASAALVAESGLLVGVDTGLTHMGTAFGVPTLALFGSTRPYLHTDSPRTRVLYHPLWCSPCRRRPICGGVFSCMRLHRPGSVLDAASELLEAG